MIYSYFLPICTTRKDALICNYWQKIIISNKFTEFWLFSFFLDQWPKNRCKKSFLPQSISKRKYQVTSKLQTTLKEDGICELAP